MNLKFIHNGKDGFEHHFKVNEILQYRADGWVFVNFWQHQLTMNSKTWVKLEDLILY